MGLKRSAEDLDTAPAQMRRVVSKRKKLSPAAEDRSNSSDPSAGSVSEDSALESTPTGSTLATESSVSSVQTAIEEEDSDGNTTSSSEADSSDESSDADVEDFTATIGAPKKPSMDPSSLLGGAQDLHSRLMNFLPQLAEANRGLAGAQKFNSMEEVEEGEQHIEMNLGLGVLEHREDTEGEDESVADSSSDKEEEDDEDREASHAAQAPIASSNRARERNIIGKLLRHEPPNGQVGIEEIG